MFVPKDPNCDHQCIFLLKFISLENGTYEIELSSARGLHIQGIGVGTVSITVLSLVVACWHYMFIKYHGIKLCTLLFFLLEVPKCIWLALIWKWPSAFHNIFY